MIPADCRCFPGDESLPFLSTMMDWLKDLHSAQGLANLIQTGGLIVLVAIIFAETGLLVGFFLPGDSLLITAGVLSNPLNPNHVAALQIVYLNLALGLAAIIGDQVGFFLGRKAGESIGSRPESRFYKRRHLGAAREFYEKYGGFSVVAARFVPVVRTFVPFVAGVARMPYRRFVFWNILGGVFWVSSLLWVGYFLGQTSMANRLDKVVVGVVFISVSPMLFSVLQGFRRTTSGSGASPKVLRRKS